MEIVIAAVIICWVAVSVTQSVMLHEAREKLLQYEIKQCEAEVELNHVKLLLEKSLNQKSELELNHMKMLLEKSLKQHIEN